MVVFVFNGDHCVVIFNEYKPWCCYFQIMETIETILDCIIKTIM